MQWFIHFTLVSTCPYHLRWFNLNCDAKGGEFNRESIEKTHFIRNFNPASPVWHSFSFRRTYCIPSFCKSHYSLAWSNVPLTQLPYHSMPSSCGRYKKRKYFMKLLPDCSLSWLNSAPCCSKLFRAALDCG